MSELLQGSNLILIATAEIAVLLLLLCFFLLFQNRKLRLAMQKLHSRMERLVKDLKAARSAVKEARQAPAEPSADYKHFLKEHLNNVRERHSSLDSDRDIVLDIDPDTPLPRRVAALRYAILVAEKEATAKDGKAADWSLLERKYEQIFDFNQEYAVAAEPVEVDNSEIEELRDELSSAKKRINNLERFKALYFDLEEKWESCRDTAQNHFHELTQLAADADNSGQLENALKSYHEAYGEVGRLIEGGVDGQTIVSGASGDTSGEIKHLRAVAADQHKIITELQRKLQQASSTEARVEVVEELQGQLEKQMRFVQESETCIQLMEDELSNANKELEQLRARLNVLPQIKTDLKDLREQNDDYEMQVHSLKSENRRLKSKIQNINAAPPQDNGDARKLKRELAAAEARFAELEEKFLDLKSQ